MRTVMSVLSVLSPRVNKMSDPAEYLRTNKSPVNLTSPDPAGCLRTQ